MSVCAYRLEYMVIRERRVNRLSGVVLEGGRETVGVCVCVYERVCQEEIECFN